MPGISPFNRLLPGVVIASSFAVGAQPHMEATISLLQRARGGDGEQGRSPRARTRADR
jgi:hypothetical protein